MNTIPRVVLVGRTNVGKSTLFNRLSTQAKSITFDVAGVTRDFIKDEVSWKDKTFELIDTGGVGLRTTDDVILQQVRQRALAVLESAQVILFVVDGEVGVLPQDREIAQICHKTGKPVILVINKSDTQEAAEHQYEFERLGFTYHVVLSALHGKGIGDLLDLICEHVPRVIKKTETEPQYKVVLLGKPNVGKSSLMNALLKQERSIVTPHAGTTREPITEKITFYQENIALTDTPGIRRKRKIDEPLESIMVRTAFRAVDNADIVLLLIDASEGVITDQELKLAFYAFEHHKALLILFNKSDLVTEEKKASLAHSMELYHYFFNDIPQVHISCKTGTHIGKIMSLIKALGERYSQTFSDDALTVLFKQALHRRPLYHQSKLLSIIRAKQIATAPITIVLVVNEPEWFGQSQLGYCDAVLRSEFDLKGVPIKFLTRKPS